jgi:hypothetical protein
VVCSRIAIGVATGQIGEHAGAFDEPDVPASACYVMPECLCHMGFAYPPAVEND